jgi:PAS domain S-box-containing protein
MSSKWERYSREELIDLLERRANARTLDDEEDTLTRFDVHVQQRELEMRLRELAESRKLLEDSRSRYAQLYDFAPIAYCTLDRDGRIRDCNLTLAAFVGVERARLIGASAAAIVVPEDHAILERHLQRCFEEKRRVTTELRLTMGRLGTVPFQVVSTVITTDDGKIDGCRTALTDVSAVKRSEERLSLLARTSAELSASFDIGQNLAKVVRGMVPTIADLCFADLLGLDGQLHRVEIAATDTARAELLKAMGDPPVGWEPPNKPLLVSGADTNVLAAAFTDAPQVRAMLFRHRVRSMIVLPLIMRDRTIGVLGLVQLESGRTFTGSDLAFANDLGSRVAIAVDNARLYSDAQRAIKARQELLSIVSHDLRSPLAGITLSVSGLIDAAPNDERRRGRKQLERIRHTVQQMRHMVEDLLDLASLEKGHLSISRRDLSVATLVQDAFELVEPIAQDSGIALIAEPPTTALWVQCDRERVLQILSNLIGNALNFTPRGGRVTVSWDSLGGKVRMRVQDTGPGIPDAMLPVLFDRTRQTKSTSFKGRGLGLFICRGIVESHGGVIWADNPPEGGAALHFTLPVSRAHGRAGDGTIMVVEDDPSLREVIATLLTENGYNVAQASNGREALAWLEANRAKPELVLLDLNLPLMDGRELARAMKERPQLAQIPVLLISSQDKLEDEAQKLGVAGTLKKPLDLGVVLSAIERSRVPAARA